LNPDSANMWEDIDSGEGSSEAVRVAEKLLRELDILGGEKSKKHKVLEVSERSERAFWKTRTIYEPLLKPIKLYSFSHLLRSAQNYHLLATRTKTNIDLAMQNFIEMLEGDIDYLPALLGMSTAFMMEKVSDRSEQASRKTSIRASHCETNFIPIMCLDRSPPLSPLKMRRRRARTRRGTR